MKLIVGLGNPGAKYAKNRHNVGFMAIDRIASDHGFQSWRSRFQGETSEGRLGTERAVLLKPQTFMNLSGQSVGEAMRYLKLASEDVIVFHDELDLAPGKCRVKFKGGHAGHNGLRSIHQHIGEAYHRVRLGIGHPGHKDRVASYVLSDFAAADQCWLENLMQGISDGAPVLAAGDGAGFQNKVAQRLSPSRNKNASADKDPVPQPGRPADKGKITQNKKPDEEATPQNFTEKLKVLMDRFR